MLQPNAKINKKLMYWYIYFHTCFISFFLWCKMNVLCKRIYHTNKVWQDVCVERISFGATLAGDVSVYLLFKGRVKRSKKQKGPQKQRCFNDKVWPQRSTKMRWQKRGLRGGRKDPWRGEDCTKKVKDDGKWSDSQRNRQWLLSISYVQCLGEWNWWLHLRLIIVMMDQIADFPQRRLNDSLTQIWMTGFTAGVHYCATQSSQMCLNKIDNYQELSSL